MQIVAFLIPLLDDKFPLIRSITCWTLSRYSKFIIQVIGHSPPDVILIPAILGFHQKLILFKSCFRNVELAFMHHLSERVIFCILIYAILVLSSCSFLQRRALIIQMDANNSIRFSWDCSEGYWILTKESKRLLVQHLQLLKRLFAYIRMLFYFQEVA